MLQGMTGFSQIQGVVAGMNVGVELRSYNHRYLDIVINVSNGFAGILEERIRNLIKENFLRGRIVLNVHINNYPGQKIVINESLIKEYLQNIQRASKKFRLREDLSLKDLINLPGVLNLTKCEPIKQNYWLTLQRLIQQAIRQVRDMRVAEGKSISCDFALRIKTIWQQINSIKKNIKNALGKKRAVLTHEEFSIYLKTTDISEELSRLKLHLESFNHVLTKTTKEAKGKELDFIAQELQRETNTISAKCQDFGVSHSVVIIKAEIEKIREQVQNIQ